MQNPSRKTHPSRTGRTATAKPAAASLPSEVAAPNTLTREGRSPPRPEIGALRARHLALSERLVEPGSGARRVTVDDAESPVSWLARRRGRDGRMLVAPHQFQAGERLRADFTHGQMMPRTTSNWSSGVASERRGPSGAADCTEATIAARQRVNAALEAVDPEFSGLLLDLCCFLKGLEDIERDRGWPTRSAKVVLQLGLDRLARHYGYLAEARGKTHAAVRTWLAEDASFRVE